MTETPSTSPNPDIPNIPDSGIEWPKTDADMNYLKKKKINEDIRKKISKKDVYESYTQTIYNIIVGKTN